jgi:hypothetical protein
LAEITEAIGESPPGESVIQERPDHSGYWRVPGLCPPAEAVTRIQGQAIGSGSRPTAAQDIGKSPEALAEAVI